jgi:LuxR family glucitol operon transcriptional activator
LLPLTREYALVELATQTTLEQDIRKRWVDWYTNFSTVYGDTDWKEWHLDYGHLEVEWENLQAVVEWCIAKHEYETVRSLWRQIKGYAHVRGYWDDRLDWSDWLIHAAEQRTAVEIMGDRGRTLTLMGQPQCLVEATCLLQQAWNLRDFQDLLHQLELATSLAILHIRQHQFSPAQHWLDQEKALLEQMHLPDHEHQRQWVHIYYYEAELRFHAKAYDLSKALYQKALELSQAAGWQRATIAIQNWLAEIAIAQNELTEAQSLLEQGLPVAERHQDPRSIAFHKRSFAHLEKRRGNIKQALRWAVEAHEGFENLRMLPEAQETEELIQSLTEIPG